MAWKLNYELVKSANMTTLPMIFLCFVVGGKWLRKFSFEFIRGKCSRHVRQ